MARRLRFIPEGSLVEVTARTVQGRFLLKPGPGWTETFVGILARAQELFPVRIHAFVCLSIHLHLLVTPDDAPQLAPSWDMCSHGTKENLVARPSEWPGRHCAEALRIGEPVRGVWVSRTTQWVARNRGQELSDEQASIAYKLHLDPLPCWQHWSAKRYQRQIAELLQHIEQEALERHERDETAPLGVAEILAQHPHAAPDKMKRAPG